MAKILLTESDGNLVIGHGRSTMVGIGVILGLQSLFFLTFAFQDEGLVSHLTFVIFCLTLLLAVFISSLRWEYTLDREFRFLEKRFRAVLIDNRTRFDLDEFEKVGIGIAGRGSSQLGASVTVRFVQLVGGNSKGVKISVASGDSGAVFHCAQQVADYLGLPLDDKPKTVWFGKCFD